MMKYLKKYEYYNSDESDDKGSYWLLPTDERFKKSLKQINCAKEFIHAMLTNDTVSRYVFIGFNNNNINDRYNWGWNPYFGTMNDKHYDKIGYKFMGTINIPNYELEANKYNI